MFNLYVFYHVYLYFVYRFCTSFPFLQENIEIGGPMNVRHVTHIDRDFTWTSQTDEDVASQVNDYYYLLCFYDYVIITLIISFFFLVK